WGRVSSWMVSIGNELEQRAIGVAKIDARPRPLRAEAFGRPGVDLHAAALEMSDGRRDRPVPFETEIAVAGLDGQPRHFGGMKARTMQIELHGAESICPALRPGDELGAEHVAVECVRALPVGHMHDAMIELDRQRHRRLPAPRRVWMAESSKNRPERQRKSV